MEMGVDGFGCVRWGAGIWCQTKTRQVGDIQGHTGQNLGPYGQGNFPGHDGFSFWPKKRSKMGEDGCGWMRMGGMGSILTGGNKKGQKEL